MYSLLLLSTLALSSSVRASTQSLADQCCVSIQEALPSAVFYSNNSAYVEEESTYYSAQQAALTPACRVAPTSSDDVSQIMKVAISTGCLFAVRSGGHMNWNGSSNIDASGFTIDMEQMSTVSLASDQKTATAQSGAAWSKVYDLLTPLNLTVVGGRASTVGVGGFLVAGGISFLSYQHGLANNYIAQYEIVLANGTIVNASATENTDLYWAMGLGSTNYGIVTSYILETFPLDGMWGGTVGLNISQAPEVMDYLANFTLKLNDDPEGLSAVTLAWNPDVQDYDLFISNAYLHPESFPPLFSGLEEFVPSATTNTLAVTNITSLTAAFAAGDPSGFRTNWWTLTFDADAQIVLDVFDYGKQLFADLVTTNGTQWSLDIQPIDQKFIQATQAGNNPSGLSGDNLFLILEHVIWTDPSLDDEVHSKAQQFLDYAQNLASQRGVLNQWLYLNYADGSQPIYEQIGDSNLERLQKAKSAYDPSNLLGQLWRGGFKLPQ